MAYEGKVIGLTGLFYNFRNQTTAPPSNGEIRFNNSNLVLATEVYLSFTDNEGDNVEQIMTDWPALGTVLAIQSVSSTARYVQFEIVDITNVTSSHAVWTVVVAKVSPVTFGNNENVHISTLVIGIQQALIYQQSTGLVAGEALKAFLASSSAGSLLSLNNNKTGFNIVPDPLLLADKPIHFKSNTTTQNVADINPGDIIWNEVVQGDSTIIYLSNTTADGVDISELVDLITPGSSITLIDSEQIGTFQQYNVDNIGWFSNYITIHVTISAGANNNFLNDRTITLNASSFSEIPPAIYVEDDEVKASELMQDIMQTEPVGSVLVIAPDKQKFIFSPSGSGIVPVDEPTAPPDLPVLPDVQDIQAILDYAKQIAADLKAVGIYK